MTLKSILKKPSGPSALTPEEKAQQAREAAIRQARIIHAQRDIDLKILESIEAMLDFPASQTPPELSADPASPDPGLIKKVQDYLLTFQPSDFDDLIEERRVAGVCGYVFCPAKPRRGGSAGQYMVVRNKSGGKIVDRKMVETWCSDNCARRAMYIKVQLLEEPASLRDVLKTPPVTLMPEGEVSSDGNHDDGSGKAAFPHSGLVSTSVESHPAVARALQDLSHEKGGSELTTISGLLSSEIVYKDNVKAPRAPVKSKSQLDHARIDGYVPITRTIWENSVPRQIKK